MRSYEPRVVFFGFLAFVLSGCGSAATKADANAEGGAATNIPADGAPQTTPSSDASTSDDASTSTEPSASPDASASPEAGASADVDGDVGCFDPSTAVDTTLTAVPVSSYGAHPNDGVDDVAAIAKAAQSLQSGQKLVFEPGTYDLAYSKIGTIMSFNNLSHIEIDGNGAAFLVHGYDASMPPVGGSFVSLNASNDVYVHDLSFDWDRPPFSQGTVMSSSGNTMTVQFDAAFPVDSNMIIDEIMNYFPNGLPKGNGLDDYPSGDTTKYSITQVSSQVLKITLMYRSDTAVSAGDRIVVRHGDYEFHGITFGHGSNLTVYNVTIYTTSGMAIAGGEENSVRIKQFNVTKGPGRLMSTTADGIHISSGLGTFLICDSTLEGMGDDGLNLDGAVASISSVDSSTRTVHFTPAYTFDKEMSVGDTVAVLNAEQAQIGTAVITPASNIDNDVLVLDQLPAGTAGGGGITSLTDRPSSIHLERVQVLDNRARGALLADANLTIDHSTFNGDTMAGVLVDSSLGGEGPGANHVVIKNSTFTHSGVSGIWPAILFSAECGKNTCAASVHDNVQMIGNAFQQITGGAVDLSATSDVTISGNTMTGLGASGTKASVVTLANTASVMITGNTLTSSNAGGVTQSNSTGVTVSGNTGF